MNHQQRGSVLLLVIIMLSGIVLYCTIVWHTTSYLVQLSQERLLYETNNSKLCALMQWATVITTHFFNDIATKAQEKAFSITIDQWPPVIQHLNSNKTSLSQGIITWHALSGNSISIDVSISPNKERHIIQSTIKKLIKNDTILYEITNWHYVST